MSGSNRNTRWRSKGRQVSAVLQGAEVVAAWDAAVAAAGSQRAALEAMLRELTTRRNLADGQEEGSRKREGAAPGAAG